MRHRQVRRRFAARFLIPGARARLGFGALLAAALGLAAMVFTGAFALGATALPDGRAYELVSPTEKGGNDAEPRSFPATPGLAGEDETGLLYTTLNGLPGSEGTTLLAGNVAQRGSSGWATTPLSPPELNQGIIATGVPMTVSNDLENALVASPVPLTPGAPSGWNIYLRRTHGPAYQLVTDRAIPRRLLEEEGVNYNTDNAVGASKDFSHVFFHTEWPLTEDSPQTRFGQKLYEFSGGSLHNVGILPGKTTPDTHEVATYPPITRPVSEDGSQVIFSSEPEGAGPPPLPAQLFLRTNDARTVEISEPEAGVEDPDGPQTAFLIGANASGSVVYFISASTLTADAYTGKSSGGTTDLAPNLYRYDVAGGRLTDLTITKSGEEEGAEERGAEVKSGLVSPSGEGVFFVARGILAPGAVSGADNLYHWGQGDGVTFVADLEASDKLVANADAPEAGTDTSGNAIAFVSTGGLAGHTGAAGVPEVYRWAVAEGLSCVSCGSGPTYLGAEIPLPGLALGSGANHPISADGTKVFFTTKEALVPQDSNGKNDVYEWEGGADHLLSSGTGNSGSYLVDASPSGKDVFFATRDQLVAADRDENLDIYDAREGGGFPVSTVTPPCEAEACRPAPAAAPPPPPIASRVFDGPGNKKPKRHAHEKRKKKQEKHRGKGCTAKGKRCSNGQHKSRKGRAGGKRG